MNYRFTVQLRGLLVSQIFVKAMAVPQDVAMESAALSLMGTDVEEAVEGIPDLHEIWISSLETGVAVYILSTFINAAAAIAVVAIICE